MKKIILFLALIILAGCSGTKKITTSDLKSNIDTKTEVSKNTEVKESGKTVDKSTAVVDSSAQKYLAQIEKLTAQYEARLRTYDTSKPINPKTGTPPIASDLTITNKTDNSKETNQGETSQIKKAQNTDVEIDYKLELQQRIDSLQKVNANLKSNTESKEVPVSYWWFWILIGILIPVLVWFIVKFDWHAKLFVWILNLFRLKK
jgi:uncharacterized protein YcfL